MNAPDPYRTLSPAPGQIWCDKQIASRRVLILEADGDRVHFVSSYSATPGLAGFDEVLERYRRRGAPPSMKRSRWKSCFRFESHPADLSGGTDG